jgi:protein-L-isoaspartate(D-aspartate) O-methyltransferase
MDDLLRRHFAEEIDLFANVRTDGLTDAFASVHREDFLGPGPWQVLTVSGTGQVGYRMTRDADVRHVYHNSAIAIDPSRQINNGQPGAQAVWIDALALGNGDRVVHIGCGTGYYTAIIATVVGPTGRVTAYETEEDLAGRASRNLAPWPHVRVIGESAIGGRNAECDALYVNAGATHILPQWLDAVAPGGRLLVPLTFSPSPAGIGSGITVVATNTASGWTVRPIGPVSIYPCQGARDESANQALAAVLRAGTWRELARLRRDRHEREESCRLHNELTCIAAA